MAKGDRTPRNYDGIKPTGKLLGDLLPKVFSDIGDTYNKRGDLILAAWPEIIGEKLAPMTAAVAFEGGVLTVKVKNSTLYSLLSTHEKGRLLKALKEKFPKSTIRNIVFRMG